MKDITQLTKQQLVLLTEEEIEMYKKVVLMQEGIIELPPVTVSVEPIESLPRQTIYYTNTMYFTRREDAEAAAALSDCTTDYDYSIGHNPKFVRPLDEPVSVQTTSVVSEEVYRKAAQELKAYNQQKDKKRELEEEYRQNQKDIAKATSHIGELYYAALEEKESAIRTINLFTEYVELAEDGQTAYKFLEKSVGEQAAALAKEWFPNEFAMLHKSCK